MQQLSLQRLFFTNVFDHVITVNKDDNTAAPVPVTKDEVFDLVVSSYIDKVYRYVNFTFGLQKHATDDIVQEVFLQLPRKLARFDTSRKLEPWLFKVTHNIALDFIKKNKRKTENEMEIDIVATEDFLYQISTHEGNLPQNLEKAYHEWLLRIVLSKLKNKSRQLIILYYFEHKPYEEVAITMWIKANGVGTLLARAKKELKHLIQQDPLLHDALIYDLESA